MAPVRKRGAHVAHPSTIPLLRVCPGQLVAGAHIPTVDIEQLANVPEPTTHAIGKASTNARTARSTDRRQQAHRTNSWQNQGIGRTGRRGNSRPHQLQR